MTIEEAGGVQPPIIELRSVSRTFDPDKVAGIHEISLTIRAGELVAIVGPSGAGKSTLLNILGLLDRATTGRYLFDGIDVSSLSEAQRDSLRSTRLGFVFQSSFVLGADNALENAALGLRVQGIPLSVRSARAGRALEILGIRERAATAARLLSGGERQRLALARAIATEPTVLLADEPTGNLDSESSRVVIDHLKKLNASGTTVVIITHDRSIAAEAPRQVEIVDGRAREIGPAIARTEGRSAHRSVVDVRRQRRTVLLDDFGEALNSIMRRAGRSLLLVLSFALGIAGMIMALGMSESAAAQVSQRLTQAALDEVRVNLEGGSDLLRAEDQRLEEWIQTLSALPHVESVAFVATVGASSAEIRRLSPSGTPPPEEYFLMAASSDYFQIAEADLRDAQNIGLLDDSRIRSVAWVSDVAREQLELPAPSPGSSLWIAGRRVDVIGEITAGARVGYLGRAVIVSRDVLAAIPGASVALVVRTAPGFPAAIADAIPVALDPANPGQFTVETVADLRALRFGVSNDLGAFVGALAAILLVLATISASATMYLSVIARTSEIALRRAIGASRFAVGRLFLAEGFIVGFLGGAIGSFSGTIAAILGASAQGWIPVLPPVLPVFSVAIGVVTGLVSAVIPAVTAGRLDPATAIRG